MGQSQSKRFRSLIISKNEVFLWMGAQHISAGTRAQEDGGLMNFELMVGYNDLKGFFFIES